MKIHISLLFVLLCAVAPAAYGQFIGPGAFQGPSAVSIDLQTASDSIKAGDYRSAELPLKRVLAAQPKNISGNHLMGVYCQAKQEFAASVSYLTVAIERFEANPDPYRTDSELADFYKTRADSYGFQGNFPAAIKDVTTAIRLDPEYEDFLLVLRAWLELYAQRNDEAYKDAMAGIEMGAESKLNAQIVALIALRRMGKMDEIRKLFPGKASSLPIVMQFIRGEITSAQLLQAGAGNKDLELWLRAIAGEMARINGDKKTAREHFEWVKANGHFADSIVQLAAADLAELGK
jgi:tetratricopeptide (TPR) repeat protein